MKYPNVKDYIVVLEDVIPSSLCDDIIEEYKDCNLWNHATVGYDSGSTSVNPSVRSCQEISLSHESVIVDSLLRRELDNRVFACVGNIIKMYANKFPECKIFKDDGYQLLRYEVGQRYVQHTDHIGNLSRMVSCSLLLNDNYEGGEWAFFDGEYILKPKKGSAIVFPSTFIYPHQILPVMSGTRYSIVSWFN